MDRELIDRALRYANAKDDEKRAGEPGEGTTLLRCLCLALEEIGTDRESLRASLTRVEEERDGRPTIEEWSNEIDRVRDHWKGKLAAQAQDVLNVINPILQGPAGVELSSEQCKQLVLLEDRLSRGH